MGSEASQTKENLSSTTPTLSLLTLPHLKLHHHKQHSITNFTSHQHTTARVPFSWEEQPGKPLPCLALTVPSTDTNNTTTIKSLELPPRLLYDTTPSPTTVLEGPYPYNNIGRSYSFRFLRKSQGSFDGSLSFRGSGGSSPEKGLLAPVVLSRSSTSRRCNKGWFGSWRTRQHNLNVHGGSFVFPSFFSDEGTGTSTNNNTSSDGGDAAMPAIKVRKANFLGLSTVKSHFWVEFFGAFKQVIPSPRRKNVKKDAW